MTNPADREIRLALWKLHILHHASQQEVYGLWMLQELAQHGHAVSPGTLYPILARMARHGWLAATPSRAKARRGYGITPKGRALLKQLRAEVAELHGELERK